MGESDGVQGHVENIEPPVWRAVHHEVAMLLPATSCGELRISAIAAPVLHLMGKLSLLGRIVVNICMTRKPSLSMCQPASRR
jgi:hypothetical protein